MNKVFTILAGIILIPAFLFSSESGSLSVRDRLTTPILTRISLAPWIDSRSYSDMPEEQRFPKMIEDFAFDAWVATKAKTEGLQLSPQEKELISIRQKEIEYGLAIDLLSKKMEVTEEEIARYSPSWTSTLPERWEVFYIFIDDTGAAADSEKIELEKQAFGLKEQLTPENFIDIARLWSDAPDSAEGGSLGAINPDSLGPTFASNIKKTPVGTIGGPYRTTSGWNIFYIRSHTPSKERKFSRDKLREMTAMKKADDVAQKAYNSPEEWKFLIRDLGALDHPDTKIELTIMENYILSKMYIRNQSTRQKPTGEQLLELYREKQTLFQRPPCRKAREILLTSDDWSMGETREAWIARRNVRNRARDLRERVIKGEDFSSLARKYSIAKTAPSGGELGWIQEPSSFLYDTTLGSLKAVEVSPPMATEKGYLLLQLVDEKRDQQIPFEEAREKCENLWRRRLQIKLMGDLEKEFRKDEK
jgi:parvulin-like peptidyl-prolyl isomerase